MRRRLRSVLLSVCLLTLAGPLGAVAHNQPAELGQLSGDELYDLTAMALTPADLEDLGLEGYGQRGGWTDTLDEEYVNNLETPLVRASAVEEKLEESGFIASRAVQLDIPSEDDPAVAGRRVMVWVEQHENPDALEEVVDLYVNHGDEDVEGTEEIGDYSHIVSFENVTDDNVPATVMTIAFSWENLIGQIEVAEFQGQLPDEEPTLEEIEALAERLLERMEQVVEDGAPGLSTMVLRFESDGEQVFSIKDNYVAYDGEPVPTYDESADAQSDRGATYEDIGLISQYQMDQGIVRTDGPPLVQWTSRVRQFDRTRDARDYLEGVPGQVEDGSIIGSDVEFENLELEELDDLADGAVFFSGDIAGAGYSVTFVYMRVGEYIIHVGFFSSLGVFEETDVLIGLAEAQAECVEEGECDLEYPVPDELIEFTERG
ncbi:MAG: hypothetical protein M3Y37_08425 [Chloroflexota bacterium]|nr:hypothetical protein [Chloroflexota bacterium]